MAEDRAGLRRVAGRRGRLTVRRVGPTCGRWCPPLGRRPIPLVPRCGDRRPGGTAIGWLAATVCRQPRCPPLGPPPGRLACGLEEDTPRSARRRASPVLRRPADRCLGRGGRAWGGDDAVCPRAPPPEWSPRPGTPVEHRGGAPLP